VRRGGGAEVRRGGGEEGRRGGGEEVRRGGGEEGRRGGGEDVGDAVMARRSIGRAATWELPPCVMSGMVPSSCWVAAGGAGAVLSAVPAASTVRWRGDSADMGDAVMAGRSIGGAATWELPPCVTSGMVPSSCWVAAGGACVLTSPVAGVAVGR
jgi:hypothetical protein